MTNAEPSRKTYVVRGADRQTGESRIEVIDAIDEQEATVFASARGLLVASIAEHHPGEPIGDPKSKAEADPEPIAKRRPSKRGKAKGQDQRLLGSFRAVRLLGIFLATLPFTLILIAILGTNIFDGADEATLIIYSLGFPAVGFVFIALGSMGIVLNSMPDRIAEAIKAKDAGE